MGTFGGLQGLRVVKMYETIIVYLLPLFIIAPIAFFYYGFKYGGKLIQKLLAEKDDHK